jgi:2-polyprenyl-3-methyl-5-hydroxy-6-metoxy-1,4-benzoquinol methylase
MKSFKEQAAAFCTNSEEMEYTMGHIVRLEHTYKTCLKFLRKNDRILSIGAGNSIVEKFLLRDGYDVTLFDFEENFSEYKASFASHDFKYIIGNIMDHQFTTKFDFIILCEIVEHLPLAPSALFSKARSAMNSKARIIVTTPNMARISNIIRMIKQQPILPEPEKTFGPVNRENQATHRREYTIGELKTAFPTANLDVIYDGYYGSLKSGLVVIAENA